MRDGLSLMLVLLTTVAAVSGCAVNNAGSTISAERPGPEPAGVSVPITLAQVAGMGASRALVRVSVGGGAPTPVVLDTGSSGLRILSTALGPNTAPLSGSAHTVHYGGGDFDCVKVRAEVALTGSPARTPNPIVVDEIDPATNPDSVARLAGRAGAQGILGIAPAVPPGEPNPVLSPLAQLGAPLADGFAIALPTPGHPAGALTLGPPTRSPATRTVALQPEPGRYPDGRPAWRKDVVLCWTVGTASGCGPTNLDTGAGSAVASPDVLPAGPRHGASAPAGTPVSIATRQGTILDAFTITATTPAGRLAYHRLLGPTVFNTGIGFYLTHTVAWDVRAGQLLITPTH